MIESSNFNFNLPSRDTDDIVDINLISENFEIIDDKMVEKVSGKGLSTNDYTNEEKQKLENALKPEDVDQTFDYTSANAQSGKAVAPVFASAIKKNVSGGIISISDISPIEHNMGVKLSSDTITDFSGVTISTFGKNLADVHSFRVGIFSKTIEDNKIIVSKTREYSYPSLAYTTGITFLPEGSKILLSASEIYSLLGEDSPISNFPRCMRLQVYYEDSTMAYPDTNQVFTAAKNVIKVEIWYNSPNNTRWDVGDTIVWEDLMLTINDNNPTVYEPYKETLVYIPTADGTVEGVKSIYPNMIISTDTAGVLIDCDYNADTKKYIDNKFSELQALILGD